MPLTVRNPRYYLPMLILVAVIVVSTAFALAEDGNDAPLASPPASVIETPAPAASPTPVPSPGLDQVLYDSRRAIELGKLAEALAQYKTRFGSYPTTAGAVTTICLEQTDAGCALSRVAVGLPYTDGEFPYWYASDGATYFVLLSKAQIPGDTSACPDELPGELASGSVICLRGPGE